MNIGRHTSRAGSGLHRLRGALLVQACATDALAIAQWADRPGGGLVVTGRDGLAAARRLATTGFGRPLLVDAARYVRSRARPSAKLSRSWIEWQRAAGLTTALTDPGFIGSGDTDALCSVLEQSTCLGPGVLAVLPLHTSWLVDDIERLCAEVAAYELPIALVIEHGGDALGIPSIVDGLLRLLLLGLPVTVLRADVSALGMLCFGGYAAAVGLREGQRCGPVRLTGPRRASDEPGVLIPGLLRFVDLDQIDAGLLADPGSPLWHCGCEVCAGTDLSWLAMSEDRRMTDSHSVAALLRLREEVLVGGAGSNRCQDAWALRCFDATRRHAELAAALYGLAPQPALGTWTAAAGLRLGHPSSATSRS